MLKFFRKIRRKLLDGGNLKRYLIYAIGEILLVVIGILIALQVNNWNEKRKQRNVESVIISQLNLEFGVSKDELEKRKGQIKLVNQTLLLILENCGFDSTLLSKNEMDSLIRTSYVLPTFDPPNATIENLLNTGKIEIIQNDELRSLISSWKGKLQESKRQEQLQGSFLYERFTPYLEDRIEFDHKEFIDEKFIQKGAFKLDSRELLRDFRFCNLIKRAYYWNFWINNEYTKLESDIDRIFELTTK